MRPGPKPTMNVCHFCNTAVGQRGMRKHMLEHRECGSNQSTAFGIPRRNFTGTGSQGAATHAPRGTVVPSKLLHKLHKAARHSPPLQQILKEEVANEQRMTARQILLWNARYLLSHNGDEKGAEDALAHQCAEGDEPALFQTGKAFFLALEHELGYPSIEKVMFCAECEVMRGTQVETRGMGDSQGGEDEQDAPGAAWCHECGSRLKFFHGMYPVPLIRAFLELYAPYVVGEANKATYDTQDVEQKHRIVYDWLGGNCARALNLDEQCPYSAAIDGVQVRRDNSLPTHWMIVLEALLVPACLRSLKGAEILAVLWSTGAEQGGKFMPRPAAQWLQGKLDAGLEFGGRHLEFRLVQVLADSPASAHNAGLNEKGRWACHACLAEGTQCSHHSPSYYYPPKMCQGKPVAPELRTTAHFHEALAAMAEAPPKHAHKYRCLGYGVRQP